MPNSPGALLILSGERGAGKTSACREAARLAAEAGLSVGGIICPSLRDAAGRPFEVEAESLATGERRLLASRGTELGGPRWPPASEPRRAGPPSFSFSEGCFAWALGILRDRSGADLLVLDEVGPVELMLGAGFRPVLEELAAARAGGTMRGLALVTARAELAEALARVLAPVAPSVRALALDAATRSAIPAAIVRAAIEAARLKTGKIAERQ